MYCARRIAAELVKNFPLQASAMTRARMLADSTLSLAHFINRAQILRQYRTLLKTVAQLDPGTTRDELAATVPVGPALRGGG